MGTEQLTASRYAPPETQGDGVADGAGHVLLAVRCVAADLSLLQLRLQLGPVDHGCAGSGESASRAGEWESPGSPWAAC